MRLALSASARRPQRLPCGACCVCVGVFCFVSFFSFSAPCDAACEKDGGGQGAGKTLPRSPHEGSSEAPAEAQASAPGPVFCGLHRHGAGGARAPLQLAPLRPGARPLPSVTVEAEGASAGHCPPRKPGPSECRSPWARRAGAVCARDLTGRPRRAPVSNGLQRASAWAGCAESGGRDSLPRRRLPGAFCCRPADGSAPFPRGRCAASVPPGLPSTPAGSLPVTRRYPVPPSRAVTCGPSASSVTRDHPAWLSHRKPSPFPALCALGGRGVGVTRTHPCPRESPELSPRRG